MLVNGLIHICVVSCLIVVSVFSEFFLFFSWEIKIKYFAFQIFLNCSWRRRRIDTIYWLLFVVVFPQPWKQTRLIFINWYEWFHDPWLLIILRTCNMLDLWVNLVSGCNYFNCCDSGFDLYFALPKISADLIYKCFLKWFPRKVSGNRLIWLRAFTRTWYLIITSEHPELDLIWASWMVVRAYMAYGSRQQLYCMN